MNSRRKFVRETIPSFELDLTLVELKEAQEIKFKNGNRQITITVPEAIPVKEYFIHIYENEEEIFSDWMDIYAIDNETEEELENDYREELIKCITSLSQKDFDIVTKGCLLKTKVIEYV